jgi:hypothetical protein
MSAKKEKIPKKNGLAAIVVCCLSFSGCQNSAQNHPVTFVDRQAVFSPDKKRNPLILVVEVKESGRLSLNKIEAGTIADLRDLSEKLKAVFDDRQRSGIVEREVVIDPQSPVTPGDLEKLIDGLAQAKASSIRVIKANP